MIETLKPELVSVQLEEDALTLAKEFPNINLRLEQKDL